MTRRQKHYWDIDERHITIFAAAFFLFKNINSRPKMFLQSSDFDEIIITWPLHHHFAKSASEIFPSTDIFFLTETITMTMIFERKNVKSSRQNNAMRAKSFKEILSIFLPIFPARFYAESAK